MDLNSLIAPLKTKGFRMTAARRSLLAIFLQSPCALSAMDILARLSKKGLNINKTTAYRELAFLTVHGLLSEVVLGDRSLRYELRRKTGHHHHRVCDRCKTVAPFSLPVSVEKTLQNACGDFSMRGHEITLFGLCPSCLLNSPA